MQQADLKIFDGLFLTRKLRFVCPVMESLFYLTLLVTQPWTQLEA